MEAADIGLDSGAVAWAAVTLPCHMISQSVESTSFVGRTDVLEYIHAALEPEDRGSSPVIYAVCGLGGIGKTQVALSYAMESKKHYMALLWVDADSRVKLAEGFAAFAVLLGLVAPASADQKSAKTVLVRWFESTGLSSRHLPSQC